MRFLHTADLHIGKSMHDCSLEEDQKYILNQILGIAEEKQVNALLMAGDIYDRSVPSSEAVLIFDAFLQSCADKGLNVFLVSGNHDSPERLSFGSTLFCDKGIHFATLQKESLDRIQLSDPYGLINIYLLPYFKPSAFGVQTAAETVEAALQTIWEDFNETERNIILAHYFVTDGAKVPELSESENKAYVGGLDMVPAALFEKFDYTALGHIHKPQKIGKGNVYYSGAMLPYSFSEAGRDKSVQIIELLEKGYISVETVPLKPLHEVRVIKGDIWELMKEETVSLADSNDYIKAILTNKEALIDPMSKLRAVYPNIMEIEVDNRINSGEDVPVIGNLTNKQTPFELFAEFFELVCGEPMSKEQRELAEKFLKEASK